jgi:hypothetical protein
MSSAFAHGVEAFDGFRAQTENNRAQFLLDVPTGPFMATTMASFVAKVP